MSGGFKDLARFALTWSAIWSLMVGVVMQSIVWIDFAAVFAALPVIAWSVKNG